MTTFCSVRATETHVVVEGPRLMALKPDEAQALIRALQAQLAAVRRAQAAAQPLVVSPVSVHQLPPYPEQADAQLQHLEAKRQIMLTANEEGLLKIWRLHRRKHTV